MRIIGQESRLRIETMIIGAFILFLAHGHLVSKAYIKRGYKKTAGGLP